VTSSRQLRAEVCPSRRHPEQREAEVLSACIRLGCPVNAVADSLSDVNRKLPALALGFWLANGGLRRATIIASTWTSSGEPYAHSRATLVLPKSNA
jgi:hypothetical protein